MCVYIYLKNIYIHTLIILFYDPFKSKLQVVDIMAFLKYAKYFSIHCLRKNTFSTVLVSCGCRNKLRQTWWLKTTTYYFSVLEARILKSQCLQSHIPSGDATGESSLPHPASGGCWYSLTCGHITPVSAPVVTLPLFLLCLLCVSLIGILLIGYSDHTDNPGWSPHLNSLSYIYKDPFSK